MAGRNYADIAAVIQTLATSATKLKAQAVDVRTWFDRISTGTDQQAADALIAAVQADTGTVIDAAHALLLIQAMREVTYWAMTFAPTVTLDVRGPSALI